MSVESLKKTAPIINKVVQDSINKALASIPSASKDKSNPTKASSSAEIKFLSKQGQQLALQRVANVLNPFSNQPIYLGNPVTGNVNTKVDVGAPVRTIVRTAEAGLIIPAVVNTAGFLGAKVTGATAPSIIGGSKWLIPAVTGVGGLLIGSTLFGGDGGAKNAPQTLTQQPTQNVQPTQQTQPNQYDYSNNRLIQDYRIIDSPGASISGSQEQSRPMSQVTTPTQVTSPIQDTSGNQSQEATSGTNWLTIALVGAGVYLLMRQK